MAGEPIQASLTYQNEHRNDVQLSTQHGFFLRDLPSVLVMPRRRAAAAAAVAGVVGGHLLSTLRPPVVVPGRTA